MYNVFQMENFSVALFWSRIEFENKYIHMDNIRARNFQPVSVLRPLNGLLFGTKMIKFEDLNVLRVHFASYLVNHSK